MAGRNKWGSFWCGEMRRSRDCDNGTAMRRGLGGDDGEGRRGEKEKWLVWRRQHQEKNSWMSKSRSKDVDVDVAGSTLLKKLDFEMLLFIRMSTTSLPSKLTTLCSLRTPASQVFCSRTPETATVLMHDMMRHVFRWFLSQQPSVCPSNNSV